MFGLCRLYLHLGLTLGKVAWHRCFHFVHFAVFLAGGTHFRGGCSSKMFCLCRLFLHLGLTLGKVVWHGCFHFALFLAGGTHFRAGCRSKMSVFAVCSRTTDWLVALSLAGGTRFRGGCSSKMFCVCRLFLHHGLTLGKVAWHTCFHFALFWQVGLTLEEAASRRCFVFVVCSRTWDWL